MAGVERWWARVRSAPRLLLRRRVVGGVPFHPYLSTERCWTVWGHRRALLRRRRCPPGDEVGEGRTEEVDQDVAAGEEVGRLVRLPRRHPQLIHPSTGLLGWTCLRWRLRGLCTTSLGSTGLRPTRLRIQRLRPTTLRTRLRPRRCPDGVPGRICVRGRVAMLMVTGMISLLIVRARWLRGSPCTSMVVHGSCPCRRPASCGR